jgi:hypothetical protein
MGANDLPDMNVKKDSSDFTVYYKGNQFRMDNGSLSMMIRDAGSGVEYVMINHAKNEYLSVQSTAASVAEYLTSAQAAGLLSGGTIDDNLNPEPRLGYETKTARFWLKGIVMPLNGEVAKNMAGNTNVPSEFADALSVRMDINGIAVVAPGIPGADEVKAFYDNMEQRMAGGEAALGISGGMNPYLSRGLTMVMAKVVGFGMPLLVMQTTEIEIKFDVPGLPPQMAGMIKSMMGNMPGMNTDDVSITEVADVDTGAVDAGLFYGGAYPPGYKKADVKKAGKW